MSGQGLSTPGSLLQALAACPGTRGDAGLRVITVRGRQACKQTTVPREAVGEDFIQISSVQSTD